MASVQNRYNLDDRGSEDVLRRCAEREIGFIPWFPLAAGRLTSGRAFVTEVARAHDATPAQVALAWLLQRPGVTSRSMPRTACTWPYDFSRHLA